MIKDAYEDYLRHKQDNDENNRKVIVAETFKKAKKYKQQFNSQIWQRIKVGKIVKIYKNQYFPCDLVLLGSSTPKGICYVETKNLDGETNLKHKQAHKNCWKLANDDKDVLVNFNQAEIECEKENEFIYKFFGTMTVDPSEDHFPLGVDQVLLRGSSLRNTDWIYGVAIYTGHDSKVMMNSQNSKPKLSKIEI